MFSFMMFVHHNIMDAISFVFIEQSRALVVTVALLYTYPILAQRMLRISTSIHHQ